MLTAADLLSVGGDLETASFVAGKILFHYGDPGDSLYIVQTGHVEVFTEDHAGQRIVLGVDR
jgi:CRP-like cAMP-binding protein